MCAIHCKWYTFISTFISSYILLKYTIRSFKKENKSNKSMDAFTIELRGRTFFSYSLFYALWD